MRQMAARLAKAAGFFLGGLLALLVGILLLPVAGACLALREGCGVQLKPVVWLHEVTAPWLWVGANWLIQAGVEFKR